MSMSSKGKSPFHSRFLSRVRLALLAGAVMCSATSGAEPQLGVYRWANGTRNVDAFAAWLGQDVVWGEDFIGSESWSNVAWPVWWLETWAKWVKAKPGRRLVLAVPMLTGPVDGSGPQQGDIGKGVPVSLEKGAHGEYNPYFKQLAENLVKFGLADAVLRPGWEFNGDWYAWRAKGKAAEFAEYWRQMVTAMRAVPGAEKLQFCWNPTLGDQQFPAEQAWPGDAFVDFVGLDVYDETWNENTYPWPPGTTDADRAARQAKVWNEWLFGSKWGLAFWAKFAHEHKKPLAIPEWGLVSSENGHGGLDNVLFIERMKAFISDPANNVAWHCYFDVNAPGHHHQVSSGVGEHGQPDKTEFPRASARFAELFGGHAK